MNTYIILHLHCRLFVFASACRAVEILIIHTVVMKGRDDLR